MSGFLHGIYRYVAGAAVVSGLLLCAPSAGAVTISIGLQEAGVNGGAITTVDSGVGSAAFAGSYGTFTSNSISALGSPPLTSPDLLVGNSLNLSSSTAGTLTVYITAQHITTSTGVLEFLSDFTSNVLSAGWTLTERTFVDVADGLYATTTLLGQAIFNGIGISSTHMFSNVGSGPFSVTGVFIINATGAGTAQGTIHLAAIPLPAALPLIASALFGLGLFARLKRGRARGESLAA